MNHEHVFVPSYTQAFQVLSGAAWAVAYCKCGESQRRVMNPNVGPIEEEQPK